MKIDLSALERGFVANVLRQRAMEAHDKSRQTKSDRQRVDYEEEAETAEKLAIRFDQGEEIVGEQREPIVAKPNSDIDYIEKS